MVVIGMGILERRFAQKDKKMGYRDNCQIDRVIANHKWYTKYKLMLTWE